MKQISMKELGCCDALIQGATTEEVLGQCWEHARAEHPEKLKEMTPEKEAQMKQLIPTLIKEI